MWAAATDEGVAAGRLSTTEAIAVRFWGWVLTLMLRNFAE